MLNKPKFKIGDVVRILPNGPKLENYHGTWNNAMNIYIGKEYTIKKIFNPDITVESIGPFYGYDLKGTCWTFDERNLELIEQETIAKKPKFKIGDKVKVLPNGAQLKNYHGGWTHDMKNYIGKDYTISRIIEPDDLNPFYGYGFQGLWWTSFDERNLELAKEKKENPANIIFKFKKNKIIAKREGGLKAIASCHPDDTYDITIGMKLAFIRLLEKERQEKERAVTPIEGFYMCIRSDDNFSSGNIYHFKNGIVRCDFGIPCGPYKENQKKNKTIYIGKAILTEIKWEYA